MSTETETPLAKVRRARLGDAMGMAETYVAAWRDAYAELVPTPYLIGMSVDREAAILRQRLSMGSRNSAMLVAETAAGRIVGLAESGPARQPVDGLSGELFTLYVHPDAAGHGVGRDLFQATTGHLVRYGMDSLFVWVLSANPARWFYEAMDGKLAGHRQIPFAGEILPADAYGWRELGNRPTHR